MVSRAARIGIAFALLSVTGAFWSAGSAPAASASSCIHSGTEKAINQALVKNGSVAVLCPNALFQLSHTVTFTAPNQKLYTLGFPTGRTRATLRIVSSQLTNAISTVNESGITLRSIQIDGNRPKLGFVAPPAGIALIEVGGKASGQTVQNVAASNTRSWSTIHTAGGYAPKLHLASCNGLKIVNNTFGPAGEPDGTWADGISLACATSLVANNVITDATDGAIVVFGSPGSTIRNNTIIASTRQLLGGINMVDYGPTQGNYTGTVVTGNTIDAQGAFIKTGIAQGPGVWSWCDPNDINYGGTVTNNTLKGTHFGYGFVVNGVTNWTATGNVDLATHIGTAAPSCGIGTTPSPPAGFQYENATNSNLQPEFQSASVYGVLNVSGS